MGQLIATGIIQSAATFPLFNKVVYEYLSGKPVSELIPCPMDVPEAEVMGFL